jgi:hypothetical protein
VPVYLHPSSAADASVDRVRLTPSAIIYVAARLRQIDLLRSWWGEVDWSEADLKGELAFALSRMQEKSPRDAVIRMIGPIISAGADLVEEYVRHVWQAAVQESQKGLFHWDHPYRFRWPSGCFDKVYRQRAISGLLSLAAPEHGIALAADRSLDPQLRLFWATSVPSHLRPGRVDQLAAILKEIRPELTDPALLDECDRQLAELEQAAAAGIR